MNNASDGLISRLDIAEERISELKDTSIGISKMEKQRKQTEKLKRNNIQMGQI